MSGLGSLTNYFISTWFLAMHGFDAATRNADITKPVRLA